MSEKVVVYRENQHNYYHYYEIVNAKDPPKSLHPRTALTDYKNRNIVSLHSLTTGKKAQIQYHRKTQEIRKRLDYQDDDKENIITTDFECIKKSEECNEYGQSGKHYYPQNDNKNGKVSMKPAQTEKPRSSNANLKNEIRINSNNEKKPVQNKPQIRTSNEQYKRQPQKEDVPKSVRVPRPPISAPVTKKIESIPRLSNARGGPTKPQYLSVPPNTAPVKPILKYVNAREDIRISSEKKISFKDASNKEANDLPKDQEQDEETNRVTRIYKVDMRRVTVRRNINDDDADHNDELWTKPDNADVTWIEDESEKLKFLNKRKFTESFQSSYDGYAIDKLFYPYIEDVVTYLRRLEYKYVLRNSLFGNRPENGSPQTRMLAINVMLRLTDLKRISLGTFLKSVILFDNILHMKLIAPNKQLLVGLVCLWLSTKNECGIIRKASEIAHLISDRYTVKEILEMEMAILTYFKGDFNFPDPTDFIAYIIYKWLGFESTVFNHIVNYILICFCMHSGFSTVSPSHQAAAVVHLASQFFTKNHDIKPWSVLSGSACYYSEIEIKNVQVVMHKQVIKFTTSNSQFYPYTMYSTADKLKLSSILAKKIEKRSN
ncbi:cyclin-A1-2-like [Agrilus planipennis]|uniref:Cyclin-A1-2-like n=1 Tax=Agrilus planipennis TaxID=224129 RepID=A0A1W4WJR9_AGRPL|nr:cyclin-A1-2-like [Agrilus planipennis]